MKEFQKEYEQHMKEVVNKFSDICSVKNDYTDYCSVVQTKDMDNRYNFRNADSRTLIDMMISGEFECKDVHKEILGRQKTAKKWLKENSLSYEEYVKQFHQGN